MLLATVLLCAFVRERSVARSEAGGRGSEGGGPGFEEPEAQAAEDEAERLPVLKSLKLILGAKEKSVLYILIALLLWFIGYQGVLPWIGLYGGWIFSG